MLELDRIEPCLVDRSAGEQVGAGLEVEGDRERREEPLRVRPRSLELLEVRQSGG